MKLEKSIENELRAQISKKLPKDAELVQYQYTTKDKQLH